MTLARSLSARTWVVPAASKTTRPNSTVLRNIRFLPRVRVAQYGSDDARRSVEFTYREPCEILSGVDIALVAENADGNRFTEDQTGSAVRPPVNSSEIPPEPNVRCELIDFAVDSYLTRVGVGVGDERQPIFVGCYNSAVGERKERGISVKSSLQNRRASARDRCVALRIRGMLRTSFGISLREKIGAVVPVYDRRRRRIQYVAIEGVGGFIGLGHMEQAAKVFRSQGAMDEPFGIPHGLKRALRRFSEKTQDVRHAKRRESRLLLVTPIGIAGV